MEVIIDSDTVTQEFERLIIAFMNDNEIALPYRRIKDMRTPIKYGKWEYYKYDLFRGGIRIDDKMHNVFSGDYRITSVTDSLPSVVWMLQSKRITFLIKNQSFSIDNTSLTLPGLNSHSVDENLPE